jgi:hypothetical protein
VGLVAVETAIEMILVVEALQIPEVAVADQVDQILLVVVFSLRVVLVVLVSSFSNGHK